MTPERIAAASTGKLTPPEIVEELNRVFAEEVEAAIRYLHLLGAVRGLDRLLVQPVLQQAFEETLQHAQLIAQRLRMLGAVPELHVALDLPPDPLTGRQAIETALTFEEAALGAYEDMLCRVEGDVGLEEFVRGQISVESQHVAELKELLD
jgi:bacterioferritin (cytochrome b1)